MTEIQTLHRRWSSADDGNLMPEDIARQPIEMIRKAVRWKEKGITIVIPKNIEPVAEVAVDSMMEWDKHGELT